MHDTQHAAITQAAIASSVHDKALVTGSGPTPTGSVTFTVWLGNTTCAGENGSFAGTVSLNPPGIADPSDSKVVPAGGLSFRGHYSGDANYLPATGACEPLSGQSTERGQGSIAVSKSADPTTLKEPGGPVTFSVTITNTSADVNVTIDNVVDDKFGDLDDAGGSGCFDVPINLAPGAKVSCTFQTTITGPGGTSHVNVVTPPATTRRGTSSPPPTTRASTSPRA